jgi:serine/threonine protein kinase
MRFIHGDSLKAVIERFHTDASYKRDPGRRSPELRKLLRQFLDVCNAIECAHARGVLHRDIKPANVIVGRHGQTLVVDWGRLKCWGGPTPFVGRAPARDQCDQRQRRDAGGLDAGNTLLHEP